MVEYLGELRSILKKLDGILQRLDEFEKQKTSVLTKDGTEDLNSMINQEQAIVMELTTAEKIRDKICRRMGHSTLKEFIEKCPEHAEEFSSIYDSINQKIISIKRSSELNSKLLHTKIGIVDSIKEQFGIVDDANTYSKPSGVSSTANANVNANTYTKPSKSSATASSLNGVATPKMNKAADLYGKNR